MDWNVLNIGTIIIKAIVLSGHELQCIITTTKPGEKQWSPIDFFLMH